MKSYKTECTVCGGGTGQVRPCTCAAIPFSEVQDAARSMDRDQLLDWLEERRTTGTASETRHTAVIIGEPTIAKLRAGEEVNLESLGVLLIPADDLVNARTQSAEAGKIVRGAGGELYKLDKEGWPEPYAESCQAAAILAWIKDLLAQNKPERVTWMLSREPRHLDAPSCAQSSAAQTIATPTSENIVEASAAPAEGVASSAAKELRVIAGQYPEAAHFARRLREIASSLESAIGGKTDG